jgi:hypothetical protein
LIKRRLQRSGDRRIGVPTAVHQTGERWDHAGPGGQAGRGGEVGEPAASVTVNRNAEVEEAGSAIAVLDGGIPVVEARGPVATGADPELSFNRSCTGC